MATITMSQKYAEAISQFLRGAASGSDATTAGKLYGLIRDQFREQNQLGVLDAFEEQPLDGAARLNFVRTLTDQLDRFGEFRAAMMGAGHLSSGSTTITSSVNASGRGTAVGGNYSVNSSRQSTTSKKS